MRDFAPAGGGKFLAAKNKILAFTLILALSAAVLPASAAAQELMAGGRAIGIRMNTDGVVVAGSAPVETASGQVTPALDAGLRTGDVIVKLAGADVHTAEDFVKAASGMKGGAVAMKVMRNGEAKELSITPAKDADGALKLGLWLRDGIAGVGTLTFYDPATGVYGALGHGITDSDTGALLPLGSGVLTKASIVGIVKGENGTPGQLSGCTDEKSICGSIVLNTDYGIFGILEPGSDVPGSAMECGGMKPGPATILTTLSGSAPGEYSIEINRVYHDQSGERVMITVTDQALIDAAGGIVQGMSGSPIIQDGKLVGAVTHVFVNDPTRGYGLSIADMISEVQACASKAA
jgi:stage IV sporulation protein B